ncbi:MAG: hypothetical protein CBD63_00295 [Candidatus Pelagibacter sp. TMED203]|nr:MAG: hypothetical protein CBD63_00295 [Candidatus Pelagibacter sp. TMED203]|tara:strand:+ start:78 stop:317 length:240 start_codon:yes stop_codon:yes gene_type:complete
MVINKAKMKCNAPKRQVQGGKKFVVKACVGGKEKIIRFGDANMTIKKSNPARRKSFRARHKCATATSKMTARYWSCKKW